MKKSDTRPWRAAVTLAIDAFRRESGSLKQVRPTGRSVVSIARRSFSSSTGPRRVAPSTMAPHSPVPLNQNRDTVSSGPTNEGNSFLSWSPTSDSWLDMLPEQSMAMK